MTNTSLYDLAYSIESDKIVRAMFTARATDGRGNKNSIKIIGENTDNFAQDLCMTPKVGAITVSHLRLGSDPINLPYLISTADFWRHRPCSLKNMTCFATCGRTFLLNVPWEADKVWENIPVEVQKEILEKKLKFYVIDAYKVASESGMGMRINTIMQVCFFAISGVLPREQAIAEIKKSIQKTYGKKGEEVVRKNLQAVDMTLAHLHEIKVPAVADSKVRKRPPVTGDAPKFVKDVLGVIVEGRGDDLPVSAFPVDGTFPTATTRMRSVISLEIPGSPSCPRAEVQLVCSRGDPDEGLRSEISRGCPEGFNLRCEDAGFWPEVTIRSPEDAPARPLRGNVSCQEQD